MKLKEAYRYQNFLTSMINEASNFLVARNLTMKKEIHHKNAANPDAQDETKETMNQTIEVEPSKIINLIYDLTLEKNKVAEAINIAKRTTDKDIDLMVEQNKNLQHLISVYRNINTIKSTENTLTAKAYKFNGEGNQVPYIYDVDIVTTIKFDRNNVRKLQKKLEAETNEISMEIERLQLAIDINHIAKYDLCDTFEEIIESLS